MVQVRCPKCSTLVEGAEGQEGVCANCGFRAVLPSRSGPAPSQAPPSPAAPPAAPVPRPPPVLGPRPAPVAATTPQPLTGGAVVAVWGYILGLAAIFTFFLADYGLPFAFGLAAVVLSLVARKREPTDRRALIGLVLGAIALVAGAVWLVL